MAQMNSPQTSPDFAARNNRLLLTRTILTVLGSALLLAAFQVVKDLLFPTLTLGPSHTITVVFGVIVTTAAAYAVSRRDQVLQQRVLKADEALRKAKLFSEQLIQTANVMVLGLDPAGHITVFNEAAEKICGYSKAELQDKNYFDLLVPRDRYPHVWEMFHRWMEVGEVPRAFENPILDKSGRERFISWRNSDIRVDDRITGTLSFGIDITERKLAEEAQRESEARYRSVVEDQTEFIARFTLDGALTFVNAAYGRYLGTPPTELVGRNLFSFVREEEQLAIRQGLKSLTPANPTMTYSRHVDLPGGSNRYQEWTGRALFNAQGETIECQIVGRDVTERVQAEAAVRENEARFRSYVDHAPIAVLVVDGEGRYVDCNPAAIELLGYDAEILNGMHFLDIIPVEDRRAVVRDLATLAREGQFEGEYRFKRKDAGLIWVTLRAVTLADGRAMAYCQDITPRKQAEAALRQSERFLNNIVENIPDMIFVKDAQKLKFVRFNKAGEDLLGVSRADLYGKTDFDIMPESIAAQYVAKDREVLRDGQFLDIPEEPTQTQQQGTRILHTKKIPLLDEAGQPQYLLGIAEDITERKRAEEQIQQQLASLTALYTGAQKLAESLDSVKLAEDVARVCVESFGARLAWVSRAEPDGRMVLLAQFPPDNGYPRQVTVRWDNTPEGCGPTGQAIRTGVPVVVDDLLSDDSVAPWIAVSQQYGFRSAADFPLVSRNHAFGVLALDSDEPRYFTPERVQFFQGFASLAAAALENARLFEQTERRLSNVQALRIIDTAISSSVNSRVTLDVILEQTVAQLQVDAAVILLLNPHTHMLSYAAGRGFHTATIERANLRMGESYAGQAVLERCTVVSDVHQDAGSGLSNRPYLALIEAEGFAVHVVTPLIARGQVKGVLEVYHRSPRELDDEWRAFLETLAGQAAISIDSTSLFENLQRSNTELELAYDSTLEGWAHALELRDGETEGHCRRVMAYTMRLAQAVGIDESELVQVNRGALLHDIGKIGVPDNILRKPGQLTAEEWLIMRQHPVFARNMLWPIQYLRRAIDIPYCHHEKWDGTGYPRGLKGEDIPLAARIFAVVDVWDALRSDRPYRAAWPEDQVRAHIRALGGTHFDPRAVEAFLGLDAADLVPDP